MSALYAMRYIGQTGLGIGAVYVGRGVIVGADAAGGRYNGSYTDAGNTLDLNVTLSMPAGGVLVTGQPVPPGTAIQMSASWPKNFGNGQPLQITVSGGVVTVTLEKVGDIP